MTEAVVFSGLGVGSGRCQTSRDGLMDVGRERRAFLRKPGPQVGAFQALVGGDLWAGQRLAPHSCPQSGYPSLSCRVAGPGCAPERTRGWKLLLLCSEQKELEKQLEDVLTCDQKESATSSCQAFLKIFQVCSPRGPLAPS